MKKINFTLNSFLNLFFAFALILILISTLFSYQQIKNVKKTHEWILHTNQVMSNTQNLLINFIIAETSARGFFITNDDAFASTFDEKLDKIFTTFETAKLLTKDNAIQQDLFIKLGQLLQKRIGIIKKSIELKKVNQLHFNNFEIVKEGQKVSDAIIAIIDEINDNEVNLLRQREEQFMAHFDLTQNVFSALNLFNIALLLFIVIYSNKLLSNLIRTQNEANKLGSVLKGIVGGSNEYIAAIDLNYNFVIFNEAFENKFRSIFGKRPIIGMSIKDALAHLPDQQQKVIEHWERALKGEEFTVIDEFGSSNSNITQYEVTFNSILDEEKQLIGASIISREIGKRLEEELKLKKFTEKLEVSFKEVEKQSKEMSIINDMNNKFRCSSSLDETLAMISLYLKKIIPNSAGMVYLMNNSRNYLEAAAEWNNSAHSDKIFAPDQCWGLRQGNIYFYLDKEDNLPCKHCLDYVNLSPYLCVPLLALNEVVGVLFIQLSQTMSKEELLSYYETNSSLIQNLSGQIALSISNIKLYEFLKVRSTRDVLTNLHNRSYLNETFDRDIQRAKRNHSSIAVIMMDLDFFKEINDKYGHEAGDIVLREISKMLVSELRSSDIACRYGGEEILIIMYDTQLSFAIEKAEKLRNAIMQKEFRFVDLVNVSASFGISLFPEDGINSEELIKAADEALYESKHNGRNKVTVYQKPTKKI